MTEQMKSAIRNLRFSGRGYGYVAETLGLPLATVKTYCRRHALLEKDIRLKDKPPGFCRQCGAVVEARPKRKPRFFCSDACRFAWWNAHRNDAGNKKTHSLTCACCGIEYRSHDAGRKYCSRACYVKKRFGTMGERYDKRTG